MTDADELAAVAARTFPLACPPAVAPEHIASFVDANLSSARFAEYLTDPRRAILTARHDGRIVGYAMLIRGDDRDVELSKLYLLPGYHGTGAAAALMHKVLATAADWGALRVWLGVNQKTNAHNASTRRLVSRSTAPGRFDWEPTTRMTTSWFASLYDPRRQGQQARCGPQVLLSVSTGQHFLAEDGVQLSAGRHHRNAGVIEPINERHQPQRNVLVVDAVHAGQKHRGHTFDQGQISRRMHGGQVRAQRVEVVKGRPSTRAARAATSSSDSGAGAGGRSRCR